MNNFYRSDLWVKTALGPAVSGAQVWYCTQPANVASLPPSPLASVFSDPGGLVPVTMPLICDGFGHSSAYLAPGLYTVVIGYGGKVQEVLPDQSIGGVGTSGSGSAIVFETNGTPNFNQLLQNLVPGVGITLITDNLGNTTITNANPTGTLLKTNGVTNATQSLLNLENGSNISITQDGAGNTTINSNSMPDPSFDVFMLWRASATGSNGWILTNTGQTTLDAGATDSYNAPTSTTGYSRTVTSSLGSERAYTGNTGDLVIYPARDTVVEGTVIVTSNSAPAQVDVYLGLSSQVGGTYIGGDLLVLTASKAHNGAWSDFALITQVGGATTRTATGIVPVEGTRYKFKITLISGVASLYLNGSLVATCIANLPTAPLTLFWYSKGVGWTGVITITTEYMYATNATP